MDLDTVDQLAQDWYHYLRSRGLARGTIKEYRKALDRFIDYLTEHKLSRSVRDLTRRGLVRYFSWLQDRPHHQDPAKKLSDAYISANYRGLQQFFRWLYEVEKEIDENPFVGMSPPKIREKPVPVFQLDEVKDLLKACEGTGFRERRDNAVLRMLIDTGVRRAEIAGVLLSDLDFKTQCVTVLGKGGKPRTLSLSDSTVTALRRYLRARDKHPRSDLPNLWLGKQGALTHWGIKDLVEYRADLAGIRANPHRFRHTFVHLWLSDGNPETDLMRVAGWTSRQMLARYGASAADERARDAHRRAAVGDKFS